jgi:hypothetical protein
MIWLTWRQFRASGAMMAAALAVLAAILALTGPGLADDYATGIAACTPQSGGCSDFVSNFFQDHLYAHIAVTAVVLVLPALIGLFWGAPLLTRELEAGTHRLVWNQSVTRSRWLAVKLGLTGLAAMTAAGLGSLVVSWWSSPIDKTAANVPKMGPLLFAARGIVPIAYAAFAVALGVTVGMLVRRTLPAMAITLVAFAAVQFAMPLLVRPHLLPPTRSTVEITESNLTRFNLDPNGNGRIWVSANAADTGAWVLSGHTVDASGRAIDSIPPNPSLSPTSGPCAPTQQGISACLAEVTRLGYRQQVTYQPSSRFWPLQWYETGIYTALTLGLAGFCFWQIRRHVS